MNEMNEHTKHNMASLLNLTAAFLGRERGAVDGGFMSV